MNLKEEEMLMSNSFYQKDLTDTQWNKIKFLFEKSKKEGRGGKIPKCSSTRECKF